MEQMRHIRAQMSMQEAEVKGAVSRMQHTGARRFLLSLSVARRLLCAVCGDAHCEGCAKRSLCRSGEPLQYTAPETCQQTCRC